MALRSGQEAGESKACAGDIKHERYARVLARLAAWEKKKRRAENAIKRLKRQARYYDRTAAGVGAPAVTLARATGK